MPYVTNGNIYAPVMMLAEKAADLIAGNTPLAARADPVLPPRQLARLDDPSRGQRGPLRRPVPPAREPAQQDVDELVGRGLVAARRRS